MTDPAQPADEDVESTVLGVRRAGGGGTASIDGSASTAFSDRRADPPASASAGGSDDADELESTMLGIRRATQRRGIREVPPGFGGAPGDGEPQRGVEPPAAEPELGVDELTTFQVGADPASTAAAHVDDRTVLSSRRVAHDDVEDTLLGQRAAPSEPRPVPTTTDAIELDPEATVFDVRHGRTDAGELPPGAHEDTVLTPRRSAAAAEERERTNPGFHQIPVDETTVAPRIRRTPTDAPLTDSPLRPAQVPDAAAPRERYAKREIAQTPVYRTQPQPRERQAPADGTRAASQQRANSRKRLVTLLVVTGALVVVAVAAIVVLAVSSF